MPRIANCKEKQGSPRKYINVIVFFFRRLLSKTKNARDVTINMTENLLCKHCCYGYQVVSEIWQD